MTDSTYLCIACRLSSRRLPEKALLTLTDIPIIEVLVRRICEKYEREKVILCSTSERSSHKLREIANKYRINYFEGEKKDVMKRFLDATSNFKNCKNIVRITGDNPMTDMDTMKQMIQVHEDNDNDYTFTQSIPKGLRSEIIRRDYLQVLHNRIVNTNNTEYMTYYLKMDNKSRIEEFNATNIFNKDFSFTIDVEKDLEFMRHILKKTEKGIRANSDELINTVISEFGEEYINIEIPKLTPMDEFRINDNETK